VQLLRKEMILIEWQKPTKHLLTIVGKIDISEKKDRN
jgi:hypothetical protein